MTVLRKGSKPGFVLANPTAPKARAALAGLDDTTLIFVRDHTDEPELAGLAAIEAHGRGLT